jgi:biotin carboxylase
MSFKKSVCVIVDAYSTGKYLAPAFRGRGYDCIHIKSSRVLPNYFQHMVTDFIESFEFDEKNVAQLISKLQSYEIKCILAGSESGTEVTDILTHRLDLPGNTFSLSKLRRNKFLMMEEVAVQGLKTVKQYQSSSKDKLLHWVGGLEKKDWPVVLKPLASQSGDHVFFCKNEKEILAATNNILESKNFFGQDNESVLAQSFNLGTEYIVNTVSCAGKHFLADIWRVKKKEGTLVYDFAELIHIDEPEVKDIVNYVQKILDVVGIKQGSGTTEIKYTTEEGPVLIETAARPMAGMPLAFSQEMSGFTQISLTIEAYLNPADFFARFERQRPMMDWFGIAVVLISDAEGILRQDIDIDAFDTVNSVFSYTIDAKRECVLKKTVDSLTAPGEIYLKNSCRKTLFADYQKIRDIEGKGLYRQAIDV